MEVIRCDRCKKIYEKNTKNNLVENNLNKELDSYRTVGYSTEPIINGLTINSTCGNGKKIDLCDDCVDELLIFLKEGNINE